MRVVLQRVKEASVTVEGSVIGKIREGYMILLGIEEADTFEDIDWLCNKIGKIRLFSDESGKMNNSITDIRGNALVISQFTLHASTKKGNRPSFIKAARPETAEPLYKDFIRVLSNEISKPVESGKFGAMMDIQLINDGPVTIIMDSKNREY